MLLRPRICPGDSADLVGFITLLIYVLNNPFTPGLGAGDSTLTAAIPPGVSGWPRAWSVCWKPRGEIPAAPLVDCKSCTEQI